MNKDNLAELLIETTEILNETGGGARRKYMELLGDKQDKLAVEMKKELKRMEFGKSSDRFDNLKKEYLDLYKDGWNKYMSKIGNNIGLTKNDRESIFGGDSISHKLKVNKMDSIDHLINLNPNDKDYRRIMDAAAESNCYSKDTKHKFMEEFKGKSPNKVELHKRINSRVPEKQFKKKSYGFRERLEQLQAERAKKTQNESIAELLIEATELLTENSYDSDDIDYTNKDLDSYRRKLNSAKRKTKRDLGKLTKEYNKKLNKNQSKMENIIDEIKKDTD